MERNYYLVRIGQGQDVLKYAEKGVVAVGWSGVDLSQLPPDQAVEAIVREYYTDATSSSLVGKKKSEVWRFKSIRKGDVIVVPYWNNVLFAESEGEYVYSEEDKDVDLANQLKVKYQLVGDSPRILPRVELSEGLSRRLRVRGTTVADLSEFRDEIDKKYSDTEYTIAKATADKNTEFEKKFKQKLLENIRGGKTHLITGGQGLEELVKVLFEIEGYTAKVLSKRAFSGSGDADVEATKSDIFTENKILAQVKHHDGNTGDEGVNQLISIKKGGEYADHKLVLITSGKVSESIRSMAAEKDIDIMDGDALADWIFCHINKLPGELRARLNISDVPQFLE